MEIYKIAGILFIILMFGCKENVTIKDSVTEDLVAPAYTDDRAEWEAMYFGQSPDISTQRNSLKFIQSKLKSQEKSISRDAGINLWDNLGPSDVGGRILGIDMYTENNSNKIFVGCAAGGIFKSEDGGSSWIQITPSVMAYPVTSVAIHPNHNIILGSTGEIQSGSGFINRGVGVIRSDDGGETWSEISNLGVESPQYLSRIMFNPLDPNIAYTCGYSNDYKPTIYKSIDAGITWEVLYKDSGSESKVFIRDMEINNVDTSIIYIATLKQLVPFDSISFDMRKSTDGGLTFTSELGASPTDITTPTNHIGKRCEIALCSTDPSNVYVLRHFIDTTGTPNTPGTELWRSEDSGGSWTMLFSHEGTTAETNILKNQGNYDNAIWVDPATCENVILGGINIWKYEGGNLTMISQWYADINGGGIWGVSAHADQHYIIADPNYDGDGNNRVYFGNDGGIYKTDNIWEAKTGQTETGWESLNAGLPITQLYSVDPSLDGNTIGAGAQDNSWFTTDNGNSTYVDWQTEFTGDGCHGIVFDTDPNKIIGSTQNGDFLISLNGGDNYTFWTDVEDYDNPLFVAPIEVSSSENIAYIAGTKLYSATPSTEPTVTMIKDTLPGASKARISAIEVAKGNDNIICVGYTNGNIWKTDDKGSTWTNLTLDSLPTKYISDIAINPSDHNEIAIIYAGGYTTKGCYLSNDGGATWSNKSLPNISMLYFSCVFHPTEEDWLYIGTAKGIFASENDGQDWSVTPVYSENEGPIYAAIVELIWQGDGSATYPYYLLAATHSHGVYRTTYPIRSKYYVDQNCTSCGNGSWENPYQSFKSAIAAAGHGSEIVFKSGGTYDEVPSEILLKKRIKVKLHPSSNLPVEIK